MGKPKPLQFLAKARLKFRDAEHERDFLTWHHDRVGENRILLMVGVLSMLAGFIVLMVFALSSSAYSAQFITKAILPFTLLAIIMRLQRARDPWRRLTTPLALVTCILMALASMQTIALFPFGRAQLSFGGMLVAILGFYVYSMMLSRESALAGLLMTTICVYNYHELKLYDPERFRQVCLHFLCANVLGIMVAYVREKNARHIFLLERSLRQEAQRVDALLRTMMPASIAEKMKSGRRTIAETYPEVTVLFADLAGFTALSSRMPPQVLVKLLSDVFTEFDGFAETYAGEKIKTMGDAYMVVFGCPVFRERHADSAAAMAIAMMKAANARFAREGLELQMRIGIHSGLVVGGVIGSTKPQFDLWGETVNIASRLETTAKAGKIQLSAATHAKLSRGFQCTPVHKAQLKGVGAVDAHFLNGEEAMLKAS